MSQQINPVIEAVFEAVFDGVHRRNTLKKSLVTGSIKAIAAVAALTLLASCSSSSDSAAKVKACLALDTGGVDDKSFNASAWAGAQAAEAAGAEVKYYGSNFGKKI